MARRRKTFVDMLGSPWTLLPLTGGLGSAIVTWALDKHDLASFLAISGPLSALGSLLTLMIVNPPGLDPALLRRRQEMLAALEELAAGSRFSPSPEAEQPASAALVERG